MLSCDWIRSPTATEWCKIQLEFQISLRHLEFLGIWKQIMMSHYVWLIMINSICRLKLKTDLKYIFYIHIFQSCLISLHYDLMHAALCLWEPTKSVSKSSPKTGRVALIRLHTPHLNFQRLKVKSAAGHYHHHHCTLTTAGTWQTFLH